MKKNFKLVLALLLAVMMIVGSIAAIAVEDRTVDGSITVTGLAKDDQVYLYRVIKWVDGSGWTLEEGYSSLDNQTKYPNIYKILHPAKGDNDKPIELEKAEVEAITEIAYNLSPQPVPTILSGDTFTKDNLEYADAGMYLVLVKPGTPGTVYNPIVVSADFDRNTTNAIDSSETLGKDSTAVAKRKDTKVYKTEPKVTQDINDTYNFTIHATIPTYAASFKNTFYEVSDTMSSYLDLVGNSIVVKSGSTVIANTATENGVTNANVTINAADKAQTFTITFDDTYIKNLPAPQDIEITYTATLAVTKEEAATLTNVHVEENYVTVRFPNNPQDKTGKEVTAQKDGTKEYTFTIDGKLLGDSTWETSEVIKVGLDRDGNPVESVVDYKSGFKHAALDGAEFVLYTVSGQPDTSKYTNAYITDGKIVTDNDGRFFIPGLDVGTYYLKEVTAPKGYIKDQNEHTIVITADISAGYASDDGTKGVAVTEYWTADKDGNVTWSDTNNGGNPYTYYLPVLNSYTVTVDGNETTYTMTLEGPHQSKVTVKASDTEIVNTKGVELPSTGGIGTTIFYVGGSLMVLAAAILLITKRRMGAED